MCAPCLNSHLQSRLQTRGGCCKCSGGVKTAFGFYSITSHSLLFPTFFPTNSLAKLMSQRQPVQLTQHSQPALLLSFPSNTAVCSNQRAGWRGLDPLRSPRDLLVFCWEAPASAPEGRSRGTRHHPPRCCKAALSEGLSDKGND